MIELAGLRRDVSPHWKPEPVEFTPPRNEVHLYFASRVHSSQVVSESSVVLSHDERIRAERYYFERDRRRFIVARALLRKLLAGYLRADPAALVFSCGAKGKPALAGRWSGALDFNVSHSADGVLYAIATGRAVGVDLEYVRPLQDMAEIAARILSKSEQSLFSTASPSVRDRMFFDFWTRKEAFIKATGDGLSFPLHRIDVALPTGQSARLLTISDVGRGRQSWTLCSLAPDAAYSAALVVEGEACSIRVWEWTDV